MRFSPRFLCAITLSTIAGQAYAGAWTQDKGHAQLITTGTYYTADTLWDNNGNKRTQPAYSKYELSPYLEYGWRDDITIGGSLSLQHTSQDGTAGSGSQTNWGLGDSEFFLRKRLWQGKGFVVSAEPMVKLPSPQSAARDLPQLGGSHGDVGIGLNGGYGFSAYGLDHFADIDTQYRHRLGTPNDQVKIGATLGVSVTKQWMLMPQVFGTFRTALPTIATFTQSSADDYNLVKLQLSAVYKMTDTVSLQVGGFQDVYGKNSGQGSGVLFGLWKRL
jgi:hypothetical protein